MLSHARTLNYATTAAFLALVVVGFLSPTLLAAIGAAAGTLPLLQQATTQRKP